MSTASNTSLTAREKKWSYDKIKGKLAETLIQELFTSQEYSVYRYGMENTLPAIVNQLKGLNGTVATKIRAMPDFIVQHNDSRELFMIEVKFRANGCFCADEKFKKKNYPPECFVIVVTKEHIKCLTVQDLLDGQEITPQCKHYLSEKKAFKLNRETILYFRDFVRMFFANV